MGNRLYELGNGVRDFGNGLDEFGNAALTLEMVQASLEIELVTWEMI